MAQEVEVVPRDERGRWLPGAVPNPAGPAPLVTEELKPAVIEAIWSSDTLEDAAKAIGIGRSTLWRASVADADIGEAVRQSIVARRLERATRIGRVATRTVARLENEADTLNAKDLQAVTTALGILTDVEQRSAGLAGAAAVSVRLGWTDNAFGAEVRVGG